MAQRLSSGCDLSSPGGGRRLGERGGTTTPRSSPWRRCGVGGGIWVPGLSRSPPRDGDGGRRRLERDAQPAVEGGTTQTALVAGVVVGLVGVDEVEASGVDGGKQLVQRLHHRAQAQVDLLRPPPRSLKGGQWLAGDLGMTGPQRPARIGRLFRRVLQRGDKQELCMARPHGNPKDYAMFHQRRLGAAPPSSRPDMRWSVDSGTRTPSAS